MRFFVGIFLLLSEGVSAQALSGARFMALGTAGVALESIYSLGNNQAGIASLPDVTIAFAFEEHYVSSDTRSTAAMAAIPLKKGTLGFSANRYSLKSSFQESQVGLTYAAMIKPRLAIGATLNYHVLSVFEYGNGRDVSIDAGLQYRVSDDWLWGFHLANFLPFSFESKLQTAVPSVIRVGTSYFFSEQVLLALESDYTWSVNYNFRLGLEYRFLESLYLRGGLSANPFVRYVGGGTTFQKIKLDVASSFHPQLGVSLQSSMCYAF